MKFIPYVMTWSRDATKNEIGFLSNLKFTLNH